MRGFILLLCSVVLAHTANAAPTLIVPQSTNTEQSITVRRPLADSIKVSERCDVAATKDGFLQYLRADETLSLATLGTPYTAKIQNKNTGNYFIVIEFPQTAVLGTDEIQIERTRIKGIFSCDKQNASNLRILNADLLNPAAITSTVRLRHSSSRMINEAANVLGAATAESMISQRTIRYSADQRPHEIFRVKRTLDSNDSSIVEYSAIDGRQIITPAGQGIDVSGHVNGYGQLAGPVESDSSDLLPLGDLTAFENGGSYSPVFTTDLEGDYQCQHSGSELRLYISAGYTDFSAGEATNQWVSIINDERLCFVETGPNGSGYDSDRYCYYDRTSSGSDRTLNITLNPDMDDLRAAESVTALYHTLNAFEAAYSRIGEAEGVQFEKVKVKLNRTDVTPCDSRFVSGENSIKSARAGMGTIEGTDANCHATGYRSVLIHEYGHAIDYFAGITGPFGRVFQDAGEEGLSEGWGDSLAAILTDQPLIAPGIMQDVSSGNYLRRVDGDKLYFDKEEIGSGPDRSIYDYGLIWASFSWNLKQRLGNEHALNILIGSMALNAPDIPEAMEAIYIFNEGDNQCDLVLSAENQEIPMPAGALADQCGDYHVNRSFEIDNGTDYFTWYQRDNDIAGDQIPDGWSPSTWRIPGYTVLATDEAAIAGEKSLKLTNDPGIHGDHNIWTIQDIRVSEGDEFHVGGWVKAHLLSGGATILLEKGEWDAQTGKVLMYGSPLNGAQAQSQMRFGGLTENAYGEWIEQPADWHYLSFVVTIPRDDRIQFLKVVNYIIQPGLDEGEYPEGYAYFDGITVTKLNDPSGGSCFVAGTQITMADGSTKPIEEIKEGDIVLSATEDLRVVPNRVNKVMNHREERDVLRITTSNGRSFTLTPEHRVFSSGEYTAIAKLKAGSSLSYLQDGKLITTTISKIEGAVKATATYNFEVNNAHTYFAEGHLVHNVKHTQYNPLGGGE